MSTSSTPNCIAHLSNASLCLENGYCKVQNETFSTCQCFDGRRGAACQELIHPLIGVYIFDGIFFAVLFVLWICLARRRYRQTKGEDFQRVLSRGVLTNRVGPKFLIGYRLLVFGFALGVHLEELERFEGIKYKFYTVWNFITLTIYFALGFGLSSVAIWKGLNKITNTRFWSFVASLHYVLLEIELPNTVIVDLIAWSGLIMDCGIPCPDMGDKGEFSSYVQHVANFFFMFGDLLMCRHAFDRHHYHFSLALPTTYAIFHLIFTMSNDAKGHAPVYYFLDASSPLQPLWIFGVLLLHLLMFFVFCAISTYVLKRSLEETDGDMGTKATADYPGDGSKIQDLDPVVSAGSTNLPLEDGK